MGDRVEAWAGLAARGTFMMGRLGALTIHSADGCSFKPQPIWTKSRYKLQLMEPVKGGKCVNIGRPGAPWTSGKPPPRSEEHTSELQSLMSKSSDVFCLQQKKQK